MVVDKKVNRLRQIGDNMNLRNKKIPKRFTLAYFSGTGCTKAVCDCFEEELIRLEVDCTKIDIATYNPQQVSKSDLLIVLHRCMRYVWHP